MKFKIRERVIWSKRSNAQYEVTHYDALSRKYKIIEVPDNNGWFIQIAIPHDVEENELRKLKI